MQEILGTISKVITLVNLKMWEINNSELLNRFEKGGSRQMMKIRLKTSWIWISDQYLPGKNEMEIW